jgi:hypothetical protein
MPANFTKSASKDVLRFLKDAQKDSVRKRLENDQPADLAKLLEKYGTVVSARDIKPPPRSVPSPAKCRQLIRTFKLDQAAYAKSEYDYRHGSTLAPIVLVIGYAMPLTATGGSEAFPAG